MWLTFHKVEIILDGWIAFSEQINVLGVQVGPNQDGGRTET